MPRGVYQRKPKNSGEPAESRPKTTPKKNQPKTFLRNMHAAPPKPLVTVEDIQKKLEILQSQFHVLVTARSALPGGSPLMTNLDASLQTLLDCMDALVDKLVPPRLPEGSYKLVKDETVPTNGGEPTKMAIPVMPNMPVPPAPSVIPEVPR